MRKPAALILIASLICIPFATPGFGGQFEDAAAAYERGDYETAFKLIKPLAEQGDAKAQARLGLMYGKGQGVPQDYPEAAKWLRKAAEQGDAAGQNGLGFMYNHGQGVPQDYVLAYMWFDLAASRGSSMKQEDREKVVNDRDRVASMMTPAQIAEAQRMAREWKPKKEKGK